MHIILKVVLAWNINSEFLYFLSILALYQTLICVIHQAYDCLDIKSCTNYETKYNSYSVQFKIKYEN